MSFSENLQCIRAHAAITQEQLAELLGVSRQSVSKWESGASFPEMETLLHLCDLYDVNLDTLLRGSVETALVEDTAQYDAFMNSFARRIAGSVGAIIASVALLVFLYSSGLSEGLCVALFLLLITLSVVVLVVSALQEEQFRKRYPVLSDVYSQAEKDAFHQRLIWHIAGGIGAVLFGVVLLVLFFTVFPEREPYESYAVTAFLLIIAGATVSFIYGGIQEDKYNIAKYNRENSPTPETKAKQAKVGAASGVIMLLTVAIYVGLGLSRDAWGTAWWVFPVGGILCGVASVIWNPNPEED